MQAPDSPPPYRGRGRELSEGQRGSGTVVQRRCYPLQPALACSKRAWRTHLSVAGGKASDAMREDAWVHGAGVVRLDVPVHVHLQSQQAERRCQ